MKKNICKIVCILFVILLYSGNIYCDEYKLGAGDSIEFSVFDEPDMRVPKLHISKVGKVSFPYIGDIKVVGLTVRKLKKLLVKRYKDGYLKNPQIVINIISYRPFFVNGEVSSPGGYPYVEGLTIRKAIAIAGGLTDRASLKKVSLMSESSSNVRRLKKSLDVSMKPGDILTIGEALF